MREISSDTASSFSMRHTSAISAQTFLWDFLGRVRHHLSFALDLALLSLTHVLLLLSSFNLSPSSSPHSPEGSQAGGDVSYNEFGQGAPCPFAPPYAWARSFGN